uniref:Reverse transcriptase domain-containing protein n=1 Tax=Amphimedon queenslandica TaxID=400682 RepID=A0A1X7VD49_AMPQE
MTYNFIPAKNIAESFNQYFFSVFNRLSPYTPASMCSVYDIQSVSFSESEVYDILCNLDPMELMVLALSFCEDALYLNIFLSIICSHSLGQILLLLVNVFKSGNKSNEANYQPISLLCCVSKKLSVNVIYLDIRKAFDRVSYKNLLHKLVSQCFSGHLLEWFRYYLTSRRQCVQVLGTQSTLLPVLSGVPQRSILGPFLFVLYINELPSFLKLATPLMFADDSKCLCPVYSPSDCRSMQDDLNSLVIRSQQTKLLFNH